MADPGSGAFACWEHQPGRAAAWGRGARTPRGRCQIPSREIVREEQGQASGQPAASGLSALRWHHLGAERDRCIPACSRAGWLLGFSTRAIKAHKSRVHRIPHLLLPSSIAITYPHPSLAQGASSELDRGAGYVHELQRVAVSRCKAFFFFPLDSALQCYVSLPAPFIPISTLRSARSVGALFSGHPAEPRCAAAPHQRTPDNTVLGGKD